MKLGIIGDARYVIDGSGGDWDIHSFIISPNELSFSKILHSAFSTPARYIEEIFVRLSTIEGAEAGQKFVFNPLFDIGRLVVMQMVAAIQGLCTCEDIIVFADKNGLPVGYLFPAFIEIKEAHFLTLLSTVNGQIDAELCSLLFQKKVQYVQLPHLTLTQPYTNGFIYKENKNIYKWVAEQAIKILLSQPTKSKEAIPFTAVMPHHAGDVLFFVMAFNGTRSHVSRIAVNRAYQDIVCDNAPTLEILAIDEPVINRSDEFKFGKVTSEAVYFDTFRNALPNDSFYYYCRPSRDYNVTNFHLIDHFAFAIGRHCCNKQNLLTSNNVGSQLGLQHNIPKQLRILLHFDGGWALKVYPKHYQIKLIMLLQHKGYRVTVLTAVDTNMQVNCEVTTFKNYSQFKTLLANQDLLIGMDSFPAHHAAHIQKLPTICLFGSTRPENSNAHPAANYMFLEEGLRCRPCYGIVKCPLYGKSYCENFVNPEVVVNEISRMFEALKKETRFPDEILITGRKNDDIFFPGFDQSIKIKHISLNYIGTKVFFGLTIAPCLNYLLYLYKEYENTLKVKGFFYTQITVLHFLFRKIKSFYIGR